MGHSGGEPGHDHILWAQFSPSHPYVLFLHQLVFIDLSHSTIITPKMLMNLVIEKNIIFCPECMAQLYFFLIFAFAECHVLAVMAYDAMVPSANPCFRMSHCLITSASALQWEFIFKNN